MMTFEIIMGIPEMEKLWNNLVSKKTDGTLTQNEALLFKKLAKAFKMLSNNPMHPGLHSHKIDDLSRRYNTEVWQSYLENHTPKAGRLYWVYGPRRNTITIIGVEQHPENKNNSYSKVELSDMPS